MKGVEATRENSGSEEHDGLPSVLREASARSLHSRPDDSFRGGFGDAGGDRHSARVVIKAVCWFLPSTATRPIAASGETSPRTSKAKSPFSKLRSRCSPEPSPSAPRRSARCRGSPGPRALRPRPPTAASSKRSCAPSVSSPRRSSSPSPRRSRSAPSVTGPRFAASAAQKENGPGGWPGPSSAGRTLGSRKKSRDLDTELQEVHSASRASEANSSASKSSSASSSSSSSSLATGFARTGRRRLPTGPSST